MTDALRGHMSTPEYSLTYVWERNRVIVHVDRELSAQSALNLADSLRYFAERHRCDGADDWCDVCEDRERARDAVMADQHD